MSFASLFEFEQKLAVYTGAPYVIVTDGCTHAIELCMRYDRVKKTQFTAFTYLSIPQMLRQLGVESSYVDDDWYAQGEYQFKDTRIWDSARRLVPGMYRPGQLQCLSFGVSKPLHLGKCGAILTDDVVAYNTLSQMRSDGRDLHIEPWSQQKYFISGYHYCPTLEDCVKGIQGLDCVTTTVTQQVYPDLRNFYFI
jgi:dTDP-4-amino-4,6-dideoxygalactose transaminase